MLVSVCRLLALREIAGLQHAHVLVCSVDVSAEKQSEQQPVKRDRPPFVLSMRKKRQYICCFMFTTQCLFVCLFVLCRAISKGADQP